MNKIDADDIYVAYHEGRISSLDEYYPAAEAEAEIAALRERQRVLVDVLEATIIMRRTQLALTCPGDHDEPCTHGEEFDSIIQNINAALAAKE